MGWAATNLDTAAIRMWLRERGLCGVEQLPEVPRPTSKPAASADGRTALHADLVAALLSISGGPPTETVSYTAVGSDPTWAFVEQRAGSVLVKFRVAPPYRVAKAVGDRLVRDGVDARVGEVRTKPGSTRLFVRLLGPADVAHLQRVLGALWQDYQLLK